MTRCLLLFDDYCCVFLGHPLWQEVGSVDFQSESAFLKFKFKLYCDRRSVGQFVLVSGLRLGQWPDFNLLGLTVSFPLPLWREDGFVICSAIAHWLGSLRTHNHILLSHLRLPQPGGPVAWIHIPQKQVFPVIPPGTGFPFCCLHMGLHF
jgi:hypothetical protein